MGNIYKHQRAGSQLGKGTTARKNRNETGRCMSLLSQGLVHPPERRNMKRVVQSTDSASVVAVKHSQK